MFVENSLQIANDVDLFVISSSRWTPTPHIQDISTQKDETVKAPINICNHHEWLQKNLKGSIESWMDFYDVVNFAMHGYGMKYFTSSVTAHYHLLRTLKEKIKERGKVNRSGKSPMEL